MSNPLRYKYARMSKKQAEKDVAKFMREGYGAKTQKVQSGDWAVYKTSYPLEKRTKAKHKAKRKAKPRKKKDLSKQRETVLNWKKVRDILGIDTKKRRKRK